MSRDCGRGIQSRRMALFTWLPLFILQICIITDATGRQIYVKFDVKATRDHSPDNHGGCSYPEAVSLQLYDGNVTYDYHLQRNHDADVNAPVYISEFTKDGGHFLRPFTSIQSHEDYAAYHDFHNGSFVIVQCSQQSASPFELEGVVYVEGERFAIKRKQTALRNKRETTLGKQSGYDLYTLDRAPEIVSRFTDFIRLEDIDLTLDQSPGDSTESSRTPRQAADDYYIDTIVVVDVDIYRDFLTLTNNLPDSAVSTVRRYFAHVINGVDLRYKTIVNVDFNIHVRLIGYVIAQSEVTSPWTEKTKTVTNGKVQLNADDALEALKTWVNTVNNMPQHDHVMLFTGYDLYGVDSGFSSNYTTGLAFIGTMCQGQGRSVSVVEDHGGFQSVGTAAHELGHSLGAEHDGLNNSCTPEDRYIMAGASYHETDTNKYNPWKFSNCSIDYIKTYIEKVINNIKESTCLRSQLTPVLVPNVTGEMPGQLLGPDEQCRHIYGPTSYLCRGENFGEANDICRSMFCRNPTTNNKCVLHVAARGTSCGNKRWCVEGQCIGHVNAPSRPRVCPFGDQTGVVSDGETCEQITQKMPGYCYVKDFRTRCCSSCDALHTGTYGCEYGDKVLDCQEKNCGRSFKDGTLYDIDCCGTCNYAPPTTTPDPNLTTTPPIRCKDSAEIDSISCHDYLASAGKHTCYRIDVYNSCCRTCENDKLAAQPSCPWGDRDPPECAKLEASRITSCSNQMKGVCCQTCDAIWRRTTMPTTPMYRTSVGTTSTPGMSAAHTVAPSSVLILHVIFGVVMCSLRGFAS